MHIRLFFFFLSFCISKQKVSESAGSWCNIHYLPLESQESQPLTLHCCLGIFWEEPRGRQVFPGASNTHFQVGTDTSNDLPQHPTSWRKDPSCVVTDWGQYGVRVGNLSPPWVAFVITGERTGCCLIFTAILGNRDHFNVHFTERETEVI